MNDEPSLRQKLEAEYALREKALIAPLDADYAFAYPWALSLADFDIITRFSGSPDVLLHYAHRRIQLQGRARRGLRVGPSPLA